MVNRERLAENAKKYGIELQKAMLERLDAYAALLVEWNEKINLTAITHPEGIENKHFIDALLFAQQASIKGRLIDVGSGAGFPGVVALIYKPKLELTLLEPLGKRVKFLEALKSALGLNYACINQRAEDYGLAEGREQYTCATARAVAGLPVLAEYCLPLVAVGGTFVALKGSDAKVEAVAAQNAIKILGGAVQAVEQYQLPDGEARAMITIQKQKHTPEGYPRHNAKIKRSPL